MNEIDTEEGLKYVIVYVYASAIIGLESRGMNEPKANRGGLTHSLQMCLV